MRNRDIRALKLVAFALWLIMLDVGMMLILHGLGFIQIPFLATAF